MTDLALAAAAAGLGAALAPAASAAVAVFPRAAPAGRSARRTGWLVAVLGAVFAALAASIGAEPRLVPALLLALLAVVGAAVDVRHRIIPNLVTLPGAGLVYVTAVVAQPERVAELSLGALGAGAVLGVVWVVSPRGLGLGDVKLGVLLGAGLGAGVLTAIAVASVLCALAGGAVLVSAGWQARTRALPFGPFLAAGAVAVLVLGA